MNSADLTQEQARELMARLEAAEEKAAIAEERLAVARQSLQSSVRETERRMRVADERLRKAEQRAAQAERRLAEPSPPDPTAAGETASLLSRLADAEQQASESERLTAELRDELGAARGSLTESEQALQEARARLEQQQQKIAEMEVEAAESPLSGEPAAGPGEAASELQRLAYQDRLTSLPNQNLLDRYLEMTVRQVRAGERSAALMVIDLDRFRTINQTIGWDAANQLLVEVGRRLHEVVGDRVGFGRRGEDEFVAILSVPTQADTTLGPDNANVRGRNLAHHLLQALKDPFHLQEAPLFVSASIGLSCFPGDADTESELLEHAQAAMMEAKDLGRDQFCVFTGDLQNRLEDRLGLELELRSALEKQQLTCLWRPVVSIERGRMVAASTVVRWNHPLHGPLEFEAFEETAERTGLSVPIANMVVTQACELARKLRSVPVCLRLTPRVLRQAGITETILGIVRDSRTRADQLIVEVSHMVPAQDPERARTVLTNLAQWGVATAISGLGPGYCSLSELRSAPVHYLKTDASVMKGIPHDEDRCSVCRAALGVARQLDLQIIVAGADNHQQARFLQSHGCDLVCGDFFSPPLPAQEFLGLKRRTWSL